MYLKNPRFSAAGFEWKKDTPVFHATTGLRSVLQRGLKTRSQLIAESGVRFEAAGGIHAQTVSFTSDLRIAESILVTIWNMSRLARGEILLPELFDRLRTEYPKTYRMIKTASFVGTDQIEEHAELIEQGWFRTWTGTEHKWFPPEYTNPHPQPPSEYRLSVYKAAAQFGRPEIHWPMIYAGTPFLASLKESDLGIVSANLLIDWLLIDVQEALRTGALQNQEDMPAYWLEEQSHATEYFLWATARKEEVRPFRPVNFPDWRQLADYLEYVKDVMPSLHNTAEFYGGEAEIRVFDVDKIANMRLFETLQDVLEKLEWLSDKPPLFYPYFEDLQLPDLSD